MTSVHEYMERDHGRLDQLLQASIESDFASSSYNEFRTGLLRHIAIEEKLLFPLLRPRVDLTDLLAQLRSHHSALGVLLVPKGTPEIGRAIRNILDIHNTLEEGERGVYSKITLSEDEQNTLLVQIESYPNVPLSSAIDRLTDLAPVRRAMERAGFDPQIYLR
jgi:hypothetical protein